VKLLRLLLRYSQCFSPEELIMRLVKIVFELNRAPGVA
jgi:hypothetical protein